MVAGIEIPGLADIGGSVLKPRIDYAFSTLDEAIEIFAELVKSEDYLLQENVLKDLANILVQLADRRVMIRKAYERIHLLVHLWKHHRGVYLEVIDDIRKGGSGISDGKIRKLALISRVSPAVFQCEVSRLAALPIIGKARSLSRVLHGYAAEEWLKKH